MTQIMYIGPNIKGVVAKNQIFTYYPEAIIKKASDIEPLARCLFVRMGDIVEKKQELDTTGSVINTAYKRVLARR